MTTEKKKNLLGQVLLLLITIAWGSSFIILKRTIEESPPLYIIGIRFLCSGIVMALIFCKKTFSVSKSTLVHGLSLGVLLAAAYITQTTGLKYISPGKNAFLTSIYCVMIPFLQWWLFKLKPKSYNIISALVCISGLALISFSGTGESGSHEFIGSTFTLLCCVFYALQIIYSGRFQEKGDDTLQLLIYQMLISGVIIFALSFIYEFPRYEISAFAIKEDQIFPIIYLTIVCTFLAQMGQMVGIKLTSPTQTSLILSFEAVFGVIFSIIAGAEKLNAYLIIGFLIMFAGTMISELKLDILKPFKKKPKKKQENPPTDD